VEDAPDDSRRGRFVAWLYLVAKLFNVGVDVHGLAFPLHHPTVCSCQMRGQGPPPGDVLSCRCSGWWRLSGNLKPLGLGYLVES
jgi:hypothetical protein